MTSILSYEVTVSMTSRDHVASEAKLTILAFNKRQAERKAENQVLNRNLRVLSSRAVLQVNQ